MTLARDDRRFIKATREAVSCDKYRKHAHIASQAHPKPSSTCSSNCRTHKNLCLFDLAAPGAGAEAGTGVGVGVGTGVEAGVNCEFRELRLAYVAPSGECQRVCVCACVAWRNIFENFLLYFNLLYARAYDKI